MILVIDNYDSFIYNIVQYIGEYYDDIKVFRNDEITIDEALKLNPNGIVISPGPGRPEDSKVSLDLIKNCGDIPLLGVCLGHQAIGYVYGGNIIQAKMIMHGKLSTINHNNTGIFKDVKNPLKATRYHSLVIDSSKYPSELEICATSEDGEIMGIKVKDRNIYGVQFHPESYLTEDGKKIIKNFVDIVLENRNKNYVSIFKSNITKLINKESLNEKEAMDSMDLILEGKVSPVLISAYLTALSSKKENISEIVGSARSMFNHSIKINIDNPDLTDTCGTGGDKASLFNISTTSAIVAAAYGIPIAKHGNRSVTGTSGSADVIEKLGLKIHNDPDKVKESITKNNFGFIFAPYFHPLLKNIMPIRKELGFRTIFNILGPLVNPCGVKHHLMGVFSKELYEIIPNVLLNLGHNGSLVILGEKEIEKKSYDPNFPDVKITEKLYFDEAIIDGITHVKEIRNGSIKEFILDPVEYNLKGDLSKLKVNSVEKSVEIILSVLKNEADENCKKVIILNTGLIIYAVKNIPLKDCFELAKETIESKKAYNYFLNLLNNQ